MEYPQRLEALKISILEIEKAFETKEILDNFIKAEEIVSKPVSYLESQTNNDKDYIIKSNYRFNRNCAAFIIQYLNEYEEMFFENNKYINYHNLKLKCPFKLLISSNSTHLALTNMCYNALPNEPSILKLKALGTSLFQIVYFWVLFIGKTELIDKSLCINDFITENLLNSTTFNSFKTQTIKFIEHHKLISKDLTHQLSKDYPFTDSLNSSSFSAYIKTNLYHVVTNFKKSIFKELGKDDKYVLHYQKNVIDFELFLDIISNNTVIFLIMEELGEAFGDGIWFLIINTSIIKSQFNWYSTGFLAFFFKIINGIIKHDYPLLNQVESPKEKLIFVRLMKLFKTITKTDKIVSCLIDSCFFVFLRDEAEKHEADLRIYKDSKIIKDKLNYCYRLLISSESDAKIKNHTVMYINGNMDM